MTTFYKEAFLNSKLEMGKVALVLSEPGPIFFRGAGSGTNNFFSIVPGSNLFFDQDQFC